jgi:membrane protease YdiL (CAAX protease family)
MLDRPPLPGSSANRKLEGSRVKFRVARYPTTIVGKLRMDLPTSRKGGSGIKYRPMRIVALTWIGILLGLMPLQAIWSRRKVQKLRPTRIQAYASTMSGLILAGAITFVVDWLSGRTALQAVRAVPGLPALSAWTSGTFLACGAVWFAGVLQRKLWQQPADEVVALLLPRTTRERAAFLVVSLLAGTVEEYVMRGFCLLLLWQATNSMVLSFVLVTLGFAVAHGYQGAWATLRTGLLGAILAIPVVVTGSLLPSMIAHAGTDILAGAFGYRLLHRWSLL